MKQKSMLNRYATPFIFWMIAFFFLPTLLIVIVSFMDNQSWKDLTALIAKTAPVLYSKGPVAAWPMFTSSPVWGNIHFNLDAYKELLESRVLVTTWRTIVISTVASIISVILSVPAAYYMSRSRYKSYWILLIALPFWTNFLLRVYAWISILGNQGAVNSFLMNLGWIKSPLPLLYNNFSVTMISIYVALPFAIIPIYSAIEKFDFSLLEAAEDLGATTRQSFWKVFFPGIKNGIYSAAAFVFINTFGNYAVAKLVGGQGSYVLGTLVAHNATVGRNMPLAASISTVISLVALVVMMWGNKGADKTSSGGASAT
ncbi:MAG: ABC transporter permease [Brevinema sp.]